MRDSLCYLDPVYIPLPQDNGVPTIVKKCIGAVESRGLNIRNIYRNEPEDWGSKYALREALYKGELYFISWLLFSMFNMMRKTERK